MMRNLNFFRVRISLIAVVAALWCGNVPSAVAQISIVAAKSAKLDSNSVNKAEVKAIYTGNRLKWSDGSKIHVVDQADTEVGKKFYANVIGKSVNEARKQWTKLLLSGQASAPFKCASDKAVKKVVASNPKAIGYISTRALDETVKEILRIE